MKAFILAAGLGTRLKPWTNSHPKALVPVGNVPMLRRVIEFLKGEGVKEFVINVHHFADQIYEYVGENFPEAKISDETEELLETGGGLLKAGELLCDEGGEPILIHNVDILSNADIKGLYDFHIQTGADVSMLISSRDSTRKLVFDKDMNLIRWHSLATEEYRPEGFTISADQDYYEYAFSGIYIVNQEVIRYMKEQGWSGKFGIMDFFLSSLGKLKIAGYLQSDLELTDIGKPDSLNRAQKMFE